MYWEKWEGVVFCGKSDRLVGSIRGYIVGWRGSGSSGDMEMLCCPYRRQGGEALNLEGMGLGRDGATRYALNEILHLRNDVGFDGICQTKFVRFRIAKRRKFVNIFETMLAPKSVSKQCEFGSRLPNGGNS